MAIKKSDLYTSLWASCDELRGGMDASQYKDYVLFMLFIKYISDKYGNSDDFAPPVVIPKGASFKDMVALKGKTDIGDKINTQIIQPLIDANSRLARSDFPDFNDPNKLGEGSAMVERLSNPVGIFQKPELDFSGNRAENDDILGDAYEYLMRHFATESGKSNRSRDIGMGGAIRRHTAGLGPRRGPICTVGCRIRPGRATEREDRQRDFDYPDVLLDRPYGFFNRPKLALWPPCRTGMGLCGNRNS